MYAPQQDTWLLAAALHDELTARGPRERAVLELGTGSGALAVLAAGYPGARVTATDLSRRALLCAGANAALRGRRLRLRRGDLCAPVAGESFDLVVANPPYVPAATPDVRRPVPTRGPGRAWDAGVDGRAVLDHLCAEAPGLLAVASALLIVQSALAGVEQTLHQLRGSGLDARVTVSCSHRFGPVLRGRTAFLEARGLTTAGQSWEQLSVVRAGRPCPPPASRMPVDPPAVRIGPRHPEEA